MGRFPAIFSGVLFEFAVTCFDRSSMSGVVRLVLTWFVKLRPLSADFSLFWVMGWVSGAASIFWGWALGFGGEAHSTRVSVNLEFLGKLVIGSVGAGSGGEAQSIHSFVRQDSVSGIGVTIGLLSQ